MPTYLHSQLSTDVTSQVSGSFSAGNFLTIANLAVKQVLQDLDLRSSKRKTALSPNLFDDVYEYSCPSTIKSDKIIDIEPQLDRGRFDYWELVSNEEFDRYKGEGRVDKYGDPINLNNTRWSGRNFVSFARDDLVNKLLISRPIDDNELAIDRLDSVGDWTLFGDGTNLTADADNYVKGSSCINWDITDAGGTTAGIYNDSLTSFDISDYYTSGSAFVWAYITSATNLTNFILRIGSSSSAYDYITITTNNEGASFYAGWNLLRFDFVNKSTTGSPTRTACDYVALYMTKDGAKVSETDYRFDNLVLKIGEHWNVSYYCKYLWQSSGGTFLENSTATTDYLNCDTDEYNLIMFKTCELMERHLKNSVASADFRKQYQEGKAQYIFDNPSEALMIIQKYRD